jgi:Adenylate and Guanylate cyclase catalytic domain
MHSGPVTGGVLIGDKARFQLFGDTVNTAARMERYERPSMRTQLGRFVSFIRKHCYSLLSLVLLLLQYWYKE